MVPNRNNGLIRRPLAPSPFSREIFKTPFDDLFNDALNALTSDIFGDKQSFHDKLLSKANYPKVNVSNDGENLLLEFAVPGLSKEDIDVEIDKNTNILTVKYQKKEEDSDEYKNYSYREIKSSSFMRQASLPDEAIQDEVKTSLKDGILSISFPLEKKEEIEEENKVKLQISD